MQWSGAHGTLQAPTSGKDPICPVEVGHRSATVCHLGTIALRTGKQLEWDADKMEVKGRPDLKQFIQREYRDGWKV